MGCCVASVRCPETSWQRSCCSCAFLGLRSRFCRSFKKIHNHHSNRQLRGTCGFPRHTRGPGAFDQGCGAQHPNNDQSTACSHPPTTTPSLANWPDQPEGMHSTSRFSAFDCRCGEGLGAHRELRCKFSLFMPFMHQIPVLALLQSFPVWLSWARRGNRY